MNISWTEREMLETKKVCLNFDFSITENIAKKIGDKRIIFTGMGSSLLFPGKQAKNRALKFNISNKIEAYFASDLLQYEDFSDTFVFLCSNSGKTKEVIMLFDHIKKKNGKYIAITAVKDSFLAQKSDETIFLSCGFEKGVAATKSVMEQGLIYDSLVFHLARNQGKKVDFDFLRKELNETAGFIEENINLKIPNNLLKDLASSRNYYLVGLDNGVGEEITLKVHEIARKLAVFYPDTHISHGVAESIENGSLIVLQPSIFEPLLMDFDEFSKKINSQLIRMDNKSLDKGIEIKINETFCNYCLLAGGWGLLRSVANRLSLDIDHPEKISKVGNLYSEEHI